MKGTRHLLGIILVALLLTAGLVGAAEEQPLNNGDIIKLTKLNMGDTVIITKIKTAKSVKFDTSTDDLIKLQNCPMKNALRNGGAVAVIFQL